jgi:hypothetical protein
LLDIGHLRHAVDVELGRARYRDGSGNEADYDGGTLSAAEKVEGAVHDETYHRAFTD